MLMDDVTSYLKSKDDRLRFVIDAIGPLRITGYSDPFVFLVREIVGQMFSAQAKKVIYTKLQGLCNNRILPEVLSCFSIDDLRNIGLSRAKSTTLINLSNLVMSKGIDFNNHVLMTDEEVILDLTRIKGIGVWTAKMYLLFYLKRNDILPFEDGAFMQAYRWLYNYKRVSAKTVIARCRKWKPYSSFAARYLYIALDSGLTKKPVNAFLEAHDSNNRITYH